MSECNHCKDRQAKIERQAKQLQVITESLKKKNRELDSLHFVWCSGGCQGGVHRWSEAQVTEELVELAEENTRRLRAWWNNRCQKGKP